MPKVKAYVMIVTDPVKTRKVYDACKAIPEVVEVNEVMGPYDIVVEIQVDDLTEIPPILGGKIRTIQGIESTTSLVTFPNRE